MIKPLTLFNTQEFAEVRRQDFSLIAFGTPWSSPCQTQYKVLVSLLQSYSDIMTIARVDVENHPDVAVEGNIQTVPTLIIYQKNMEIKRMVGLQSLTTLHALLSQIKRSILTRV